MDCDSKRRQLATGKPPPLAVDLRGSAVPVCISGVMRGESGRHNTECAKHSAVGGYVTLKQRDALA